MKKIILTLILIIYVDCCFADDEAPIADIKILNGEIIYTGETSWESFNKLSSLYDSIDEKPKLLKINSKGGEALSGIEIGKWIKTHGISIEIMDYCFSACANYIFPAGNHKTLNAHAALGWHGGAFQKLKPGSESRMNAVVKDEEAARSYQIRFERAEKEFYEDLHIDGNLPTYGQSDSCWSHHRLDDYDGFFYSVEDMKKMGLKNISIKDGKWTPQVKHSSALNFFQAKPVIGKECQLDYKLGVSILYGINSTKEIADAVPIIMADGLDKAMDKMDFFSLDDMIFDGPSERLIFIKHINADNFHQNKSFWTKERTRLIAECRSGEGKGTYKLENFILSNSPLIETWHRYILNGKIVQEVRVGKSDCITF